MIQVYDLAGVEDDRRFSPHCWRVKMALKHKGLEFETLPWRYVEKDRIAFSGQGAVPVMLDDGQVLVDSWNIVQHLDRKYADRPMLIEGEQARGAIMALKFWCDTRVHPVLARVVMPDLFASVHPGDRAYFRKTREERYGTTLEDFASKPAEALVALRQAFDPVRPVIAAQPFLGGARPGYADYMLFGTFQWARVVSPIRLLEPDDPLYAWREKMLDLFDGYARNARGYPVWA